MIYRSSTRYDVTTIFPCYISPEQENSMISALKNSSTVDVDVDFGWKIIENK